MPTLARSRLRPPLLPPRRTRGSLAVVLPALLATMPGCSDDGARCGPGAVTGEVVVADPVSGASLRFHQLRARRNNDCPAADAPAGVVSLTISGVQVDGTSPLTFCVPRPDLLLGPRALERDVEVVDVVASDAGCSYRKSPQAAASGTATGAGVCDAGLDPAGFALEFAGEVTMIRTCAGTDEVVRMSLTGAVAVTPSDS